MARSFNGTSDAASAAVNLSPYTTISFAMWAYWNAFANDDKLLTEYTANAGSNNGSFIVDPDESSSGAFLIGPRDSGGHDWLYTFTRPSAAVWHQYTFIIDRNGPSNTVYVDGINQSLTIFSITGLTNLNFANSTLYLMSRATSSLFGAGKMADFAMWGGVSLTASEASALARGARPSTIRSAALINYLPFDGLSSPEPDLSGKAVNATLVGTALTGGPPVMMLTPRWPQTTPVGVSSSVVYRRTLSPIGTRAGSRQIQGLGL